MGRFASMKERETDAIVLLQWENSPSAPSPRLKLWSIAFPDPPKGSKIKGDTQPVTAAVPVQLEQTDCASFGPSCRQERLHLPPQIAFERRIIMHNLMVAEDKTDSEVLSWGPGMRLERPQVTEGFFDEPLVPLNDARFLSSSAVHIGATKLTPAVHEASDGSLSIRYRVRNSQGKSWASTATKKAAEVPREQIIRTALTREAAGAVASAVPGFTAPLHYLTDSSKEYAILLSLGQTNDGTQTQVTLHTADKTDLESEAEAVRLPREDLGLRWEVENFFLPAGVTNVAPVIMRFSDNSADKGYESYLVLFYSHQGAMYHSHMRHAGHGRFVDHVTGLPCFIAPRPEQQQQQQQQQTASTLAPKPITPSRWSLSTLSLHSPKTLTAAHEDPAPAPVPAASRQKQITTAARGCHPAVVRANDRWWLFYQGPDGNARYASSTGYLRELRDIGLGWEESAWSAEPLIGAGVKGAEGDVSPVSRHLIPVVVPGHFL